MQESQNIACSVVSIRSRFSPKQHEIQGYLAKALNLDLTEFADTNEPVNDIPNFFWKGKRARRQSRLFNMIGMSQQEKHTLIHLLTHADATCG